MRVADETAQLDHALGGLDAELERADFLVLDKGALHLGGDDAVVNELAYALLLRVARATAERKRQRDGRQPRADGRFVHDRTPFTMLLSHDPQLASVVPWMANDS